MRKIFGILIFLTLIAILIDFSLYTVDSSLNSSQVIINRGLVTLNYLGYTIIFCTLIENFNVFKQFVIGRNVNQNRLRRLMFTTNSKAVISLFLIQVLIGSLLGPSSLVECLLFALNITGLLVVLIVMSDYYQLSSIFIGLLVVIAVDSSFNFQIVLNNTSIVVIVGKLALMSYLLYKCKESRYD